MSTEARPPVARPERYRSTSDATLSRPGGSRIRGAMTRKVVLAYSGGLDTSVAVRWIKETYGCEIVCFCADIGQDEDLEAARAKALAVGAQKAIVADMRLEFVRDYVWPALRAGALYEGQYLLGTSLARPCI